MTGVDKRETIKLNVLYSCLQGFYWCGNCAYVAYLVLYLKHHNYKDSTIGLAMMTLSLVAVLAPPLLGYLTDYKFPVKRVVGVFMLMAVPVAYFLKMSVATVPLAILSIAALGAVERSMASIIDSWGMKIKDTGRELNFGVARGVGSVAYAFAGLIFGQIYDRIGIENLFWIHGVFAFTTFVISLFIVFVPVSSNKGKSVSYVSTIKLLFKNKRYVTVVGCMFLAGMSLVSINTYQPILVSSLGGTTVHLGVVLFVMSIGEAPIMFSFAKLAEKYKVSALLSICFLFIVIRLLTAITAQNLVWLTAVQIVQGISYGLYLPSVLLFITLITQEEIKASAITIAFALGDGLSGIVGNAVGSVITEFLGFKAVFYIYSVLALAAFLIFTWKVSLKD